MPPRGLVCRLDACWPPCDELRRVEFTPLMLSNFDKDIMKVLTADIPGSVNVTARNGIKFILSEAEGKQSPGGE